MLAIALLFTLIRCVSDDPDVRSTSCDCQSPSVAEETKDVEAMVVLITGSKALGSNQGLNTYILSTDPKDFETSTFTVGRNILVPCDSLPTQYQKSGTKLILSYRRKDCYGAVTNPNFRTNYGYYIDLTSISFKP